MRGRRDGHTDTVGLGKHRVDTGKRMRKAKNRREARADSKQGECQAQRAPWKLWKET